MRIKRLILHNFRGFQELDLEFSTNLATVLIGINGAGKTSVLDAIEILLNKFMANRHRHIDAKDLGGNDIHSGANGCSITIEVLHDDELYSWSAQLGSILANHPDRPSINDDLPGGLDIDIAPDVDIHNLKPRFRNRDLIHEHKSTDVLIAPTIAPTPIMAYYPVERTVGSFDDTVIKRTIFDTGSTHEAPLSQGSRTFTSFLNWFMERESIENEEIRTDSSFRDGQLEAVRTAISRLLPDFSQVRIRRPRGRREIVSNVFVTEGAALLVTKGDRTFTLKQLSHGERGLLALAGDIARRLSMAFPEDASPCESDGIVLIDEICLHLHPQWQREILPRLQETFPNVQFIVTTHSPQVVAQVEPESVKILKNFSAVTDGFYTRGRDTNSILGTIMDVTERPKFYEAWLHKISQHIDMENWSDARTELDGLAKEFGTEDGEVMRLQALIDVLSLQEE